MGYITRYRLSTKDFNSILDYYGNLQAIERVDDAKEMSEIINRKKEYDNTLAYYNGDRVIVARDYVVRSLCDVKRDSLYDYSSITKMDYLYLDQNLETSILDIAGRDAYLAMLKIIKKYYTKDEMNECLEAHEAEEDESKKQYHYYYNDIDTINKIIRFKNCVYYDINSAHGDAIREIFPKATKEIEKLYKDRKIKPENKKLLNYYVGYLCCVGHRKTYNWIVQRTNAKLQEAIQYTTNNLTGDSMIIYANTDGFIIANPSKELEASKEIGQFKVEYEGDVYFMRSLNNGSPYFVYQYGDEMKGNLLVETRKWVDLKTGSAVKYKRTPLKVGYVAGDLEFINCEVIDYE